MASVEPLYEAELRFLISDVPELARRLDACNAVPMGDAAITDNWFVPAWIKTYLQHQEWLASRSSPPVRVRTVADQAGKRSRIEVKNPTRVDNLDYCKETYMDIEDVGAAGNILEALGLRQLIELKKTRSAYMLEGYVACHLDTYNGGVTILEVESVLTGPDQIMGSQLLDIAEYLSREISSPLQTSTALYFIARDSTLWRCADSDTVPDGRAGC